MFSKLKRGVKWIMEKKKEIVNNSLGVRLYEDTKEGLRTVLTNETNTRKADVIIFGAAVSLFISTYVR